MSISPTQATAIKNLKRNLNLEYQVMDLLLEIKSLLFSIYKRSLIVN